MLHENETCSAWNASGGVKVLNYCIASSLVLQHQPSAGGEALVCFAAPYCSASKLARLQSALSALVGRAQELANVAVKHGSQTTWAPRLLRKIPLLGGLGETSAAGLAIMSATERHNPGDITALGLRPQHGRDIKFSHRKGFATKTYPKDCPPLSVQWFFAVDVPKRKPKLLSGAPSGKEEAPKVLPKKYSPFSTHDSKSIELAFQKLIEQDEQATSPAISDSGQEESVRDRKKPPTSSSTKVPVNEDFLFDVDIEERELEPAYWLGPVYDVRRGSWFHQEGNTQRPCDENLANQLEEGYLKLAPWRLPPVRATSQPRSSSQSRVARPRSIIESAKVALSTPPSPKRALAEPEERDIATVKDVERDGRPRQVSDSHQTATHRLFGPYSNSIVTYQDATTAYVLTDDFYSRMSGSVYQRFAGGSHFAGMKVTRGYADLTKKEKEVTVDTAEKKEESGHKNVVVSAPESSAEEQPADPSIISPVSEQKRRTLERHMSSLVSSTTVQNSEEQEEEVRKRDEREILDDYRDREGDDQNRSIEHLLLVTHGIGQRLGLRMETVNFVGDVNTLRKTLKAVYGQSPDLQALNAEVESLPKNCRIQVLPINWRHRLDFPRTSLKHNKRGLDLDDAFADESDYPNLEDISVDGVPAVRGLITDLALDILLYQSPIYKEHITNIVVDELNRIYRLFCERNPSSKAKVSLVGHSLGSALMWDILCQQRSDTPARGKVDESVRLDFDVEDFYALGSPIGLFQMLQGRTIASRKPLDTDNLPRGMDATGDLSGSSSVALRGHAAIVTDPHVSTPRCKQVFNIFHPTDPISYRMEPLISPAMSSLKPQPLPYTKRGIFGAPVGQGLSGIGTRVGQSVSGFWSSFSSGIASSLLNRSLGISAEDEGKLRAQSAAAKSSAPLSLAADGAKRSVSGTGEQGPALAVRPGEDGEHPPTLLETELETLYADFLRKRKSEQAGAEADGTGTPDWEDAEKRARKLKFEEAKVRGLNSNGRVDYSIQEGAFDISLIAAVASHLSYWADEDVNHFMISQLLSRHRVLERSGSGA